MIPELPTGARVKITHFRMCSDCEAIHPAGLYRRDGLTDRMLPKGGETRAELELVDGRRFHGKARCSNLDNFSRKRGRDIAIGRALKGAQINAEREAEYEL